MADRIRVQTEQMEELSSQMARLSSALHEIESQIRGVEIDRISGSKVKVQLPGGMLSSVDQRLRSGDTEDCLKRISGVLGDVGRYAQDISGNIITAAETFTETERRLVWLYGGLMDGESGAFQSVCKALNFAPDHNQWTPEMHNSFRKLINEGKLVMDGGLAMLIHSGVNYIFDQNGILATFEQKSGLSGIKQTIRLLDADWSDSSENSVWDEEEILYEGEAGKGKRRMRFLNADAYGSFQRSFLRLAAEVGASASVFSMHDIYEDEKSKTEGGIRILEAGIYGSHRKDFLGVEEEVGVWASVLSLYGTTEYELCDAVDLEGEGNLSFLEFDASAGKGLGIIDGKPAIYAKAGVEANLIKADGKIGIDVLGIKGKIGLSGQIGMGAKNEMGFNDGVLKGETVVSNGLGAGVYYELDFSNAEGPIGDAVQSFSDGLTSFCAWWEQVNA